MAEAPELWAKLYGNADEVRISSFLICQLLSHYTDGDGIGFLLDPFTEFKESTSLGAPGLTVANPNARVFLGENCKLNKVVVSGSNEAFVFFGRDSSLSNCEIACHAKKNFFVAGFSCKLEQLFTHLYAEYGFVVLCPGVTTQPGGNFCVQENSFILLGSDCMLSNNVFARTSDSHGIYDLSTKYRNNASRPIILHPHTWVSRAVLLNKGTEVGSNSVLGQGSVAHGRLSSNSIYAGAPIQRIRHGITWDRRLAPVLQEGHSYSNSHFLPSFSANINRRFHEQDFLTASLYESLSLMLSGRPTKPVEDTFVFSDFDTRFVRQIENAKRAILEEQVKFFEHILNSD